MLAAASWNFYPVVDGVGEVFREILVRQPCLQGA